MTTNINEAVLIKIRALLNMTESNGCTPAEASNALAKAQKLMLEHNIAEASLNTNYTETPTITRVEQVICTEYDWRSSLMNILAKGMLCKVIGGTYKVHIVGRPTNVQAVLEMYTWLGPELSREAFAAAREARTTRTIDTRTFNRGFYFGAIKAIKERLEPPIEAFKASEAALVVTNDKAIDELIKEYFGETRKVNQSGTRVGHNIQLKPARAIPSVTTLRLSRGS